MINSIVVTLLIHFLFFFRFVSVVNHKDDQDAVSAKDAFESFDEKKLTGVMTDERNKVLKEISKYTSRNFENVLPKSPPKFLIKLPKRMVQNYTERGRCRLTNPFNINVVLFRSIQWRL